MSDPGEQFTFFFGGASPFSQWHPCRFVVGAPAEGAMWWRAAPDARDGIAFNCAEQAMMHGKAVLFADAEVAAEILVATQPNVHKALGRKVRGYDEDVWRANRELIVAAANRAKFTQNADLRAALVATAGTTLVEASPFDRIWGIGLGASNPAARDRTTWKGGNLLGAILTALREALIAEGGA